MSHSDGDRGQAHRDRDSSRAPTGAERTAEVLRQVSMVGDGIALVAGMIAHLRPVGVTIVILCLICRMTADSLVFRTDFVELPLAGRVAYCLCQLALVSDGAALLTSVAGILLPVTVAAGLVSLSCRSVALVLFLR